MDGRWISEDDGFVTMMYKKERQKMKVYVAGPMTGIPQFNFPAFETAAGALRDFGFQVVSPAELDDPETRQAALASETGAPGTGNPNGETWGDFLARDVKLIADEVDGVVLLPGWEESMGARLEAFVCRHVGKPLFYSLVAGLNHDATCHCDEFGLATPCDEGSGVEGALVELDDAELDRVLIQAPAAVLNKIQEAEHEDEAARQAKIARALEPPVWEETRKSPSASEITLTFTGGDFTIDDEGHETAPVDISEPMPATAKVLRAFHGLDVEDFQNDTRTPLRDLAEKYSGSQPGLGEETRVTDPDTGGQKGQKLARYDLIPATPLEALAEHYGKGAEKYEDRNWEKGYAWSLCFAAMQRHLWLWWGGEDLDEETGSNHLTAAAWHCFALREFDHTHPEKDDRP